MEDQKLAFEGMNRVDVCTRDEEDKFEEENKKIENKSTISKSTWYENMEELHKAVKFYTLVSLQPSQFLGMVIYY